MISAIIIASIFISLVVGQTCPNGTNIVNNPSFETPRAAPGFYLSVPLNGIPGWNGTLAASNCLTMTLEIHNRLFGYDSSDGDQWVELDANCNIAISQVIQTVPGMLYFLSYDYSPRPDVVATSDGFNVYFNGSLINSVAASGVGLTNTNWTTYTQYVTGTGSDELKIEGAGTSDLLGAFFDNVHLCPLYLVCDPPPTCKNLILDPILGCNYVPAPNGTLCSPNGTLCSGSGSCRNVCQAGSCVPPVPCDGEDLKKHKEKKPKKAKNYRRRRHNQVEYPIK